VGYLGNCALSGKYRLFERRSEEVESQNTNMKLTYDLGDNDYKKVNNGWERALLRYIEHGGTLRSEIEIFQGHLKLLKTAFLQVNVAVAKPKKNQQANRKSR
jgi:hypothetical protein